jgi:cell division protein FtsL
MNSLFISKLQWRLYRTLERLGIIGIIGLSLTVLAAVIFFIFLLPMQNQIYNFNHEAVKTTVLVTKVSQTERLNSFLKLLPPVAAKAESVKSLMKIAENQNLQLNEISYKTVTRLHDPISYYHIEFSLVANYADIQRFVSELMYQLNFVSIESLSLSRESVKEDVVEAKFHLVLHFNLL